MTMAQLMVLLEAEAKPRAEESDGTTADAFAFASGTMAG